MTTVTPITNAISLRALDPHRKTLVMGIVNMTPDSFSGDGLGRGHNLYFQPDSPMYVRLLTRRFEHMIRSGAEIIDIGGQSTRPNAPYIPGEEEKSRVLPALRVASKLMSVRSGDVALSIDTFSAHVAKSCLEKGARILNDVSAGTLSGDRMLHLAARTKAPIVLMHMRGNPTTMGSLTEYTTPRDPLREKEGEKEFQNEDAMIYTIASELLARVAAAEAAGIRRWRIILDPGLGFAKKGAHQNIPLLRRLPELREWPGLVGLPWLVGPSRKSFLMRFVQKVRNLPGDSETYFPRYHDRVFATAAAVAACIEGGADIVRVHDIRAMSEVAAVSDAVWRGRVDISPRPDYQPPENDRKDTHLRGSNVNVPVQAGESPTHSLSSLCNEQPQEKDGAFPDKTVSESHQTTSLADSTILTKVFEKAGQDPNKLIPPPPSWSTVKKSLEFLLAQPRKNFSTTYSKDLPWKYLHATYLELIKANNFAESVHQSTDGFLQDRSRNSLRDKVQYILERLRAGQVNRNVDMVSLKDIPKLRESRGYGPATCAEMRKRRVVRPFVVDIPRSFSPPSEIDSKDQDESYQPLGETCITSVLGSLSGQGKIRTVRGGTDWN